MKLPAVFGLAGVSPQEKTIAKRWAGYFEWPMVVLALWISIEWYLLANGFIKPSATWLSDWLIWGVFVAETVVLTSLVNKKAFYLRTNWVNLLIIFSTFPLIWSHFPEAGVLRLLRLLVLFSLLLHLSSRARRMLSKNQLGTTLLAVLILIIGSGFVVAALDPAIDNPVDGIWWAWVTVTTVGYGDIVPSSVEGKIFGGVLILVGIAMFSLMTASFSAFFVSEDKLEQVKHDRETLNRLEELDTQLNRLERKVNLLLREREGEDDTDRV